MMEYAAPINLAANKKAPALERFAYRSSLVISALSVVYLLTILVSGRAWLPFAAIDTEGGELTLSLIQCVLGVAALHIPMLIKRLTRIRLPDSLCAFFYLFIICATVLGELFSLYYVLPFWDDLLHLGSGMMGSMLGAILLVSFLQNKNCGRLISPALIAVAAMCFAICIGVFWEIYEFAGDSLLGLNMQKFLLQDGSALIGQTALADTMKDLIVDTLGALIMAASAFLSLKNERGWLHSHVTARPLKVSKELPYEKESLPYSA